jgi:hypothetical protein
MLRIFTTKLMHLAEGLHNPGFEVLSTKFLYKHTHTHKLTNMFYILNEIVLRQQLSTHCRPKFLIGLSHWRRN